jgi:hypothetical protein
MSDIRDWEDAARERLARENGRRPAWEPPGYRNPAFLGRVTTAAPAVGKFMNVIPQSITGPEVEGGAAVSTDLSATPIGVYLVGPGVPNTGDQVVSRFVDYRWVAHKRGTTSGGGITVCPGCTSYPATINAVWHHNLNTYTAVLNYATACTWQSAWTFITPGVFDGSSGFYRWVQFLFTAGGSYSIQLDYSGPPFGPSDFADGDTLSSTCSPFFFHFTTSAFGDPTLVAPTNDLTYS